MTADGTQMIPPGPQGLDEVAFLRLLTSAGATDGPELMRRLRTDLGHLVAGLTEAFGTGDRAALRTHSHVLVAIAGTIGARHIHRQAQALNECAKDPACVLSAFDAADLMRRLDVLINRLREIAIDLGLEG